jgi:hypothetical protein
MVLSFGVVICCCPLVLSFGVVICMSFVLSSGMSFGLSSEVVICVVIIKCHQGVVI